MSRLPDHGVYAITDGPRDDLVEAVRAALAGGARLVQYRDKGTDRARRETEARALASLCRDHGAPLIVNDDVELAHAVGADGVHVGAGDASVIEARARLGPRAIIGVSCYNSIERARQLAGAGADYLAFGAFFPSPSKPTARPADPGVLCEARMLGLPLVAIGGINADNARLLVDAGADYLAVISAVFGAADITAATRELASRFT
ncbi:thiamine phosphate synthase [Dokdonella sp.]|uniref:thiamine phosphate synthase n=1 Tax=Dokdonella sp. TaxID=2291710 RepID=UPI0025C2B266|nr:thiamine phosphate synthase [Dokdonella sp.]MBX3691859.1 thiamine phosphate synthase [Dokdonella sp.]MCW5568367.1 thiamine phosphate synthase [Dokdonella sp.]